MAEGSVIEKLDRLKAFCNLPQNAPWNNYDVLKTALQCEQKDVVLLLLNVDCKVNSESDVTDNTPLHYAVKLEDTQLIELLISKGASLTCQNQKGDTPLHVAAMSRNTEIVDLLLRNIESTQYVNPANNFGLTHMHIACMRDKPDIVEEFLKSGVGKDISVNLDSPFWPGYTPLHFAVEFCCLDVVQLLIKHNAYHKCRNAQGIDPYYLSYCKYQNASMINFFIHAHYSSDKKINFHVACLEGDEGIVEKYLKHGAKDGCKISSISTHKTSGNLDFLMESEATDSCTDISSDRCILEDDTPLHCAARSKSVDTVKLLLENNADIYRVNAYDMTPLHAAFYQHVMREDWYYMGVFEEDEYEDDEDDDEDDNKAESRTSFKVQSKVGVLKVLYSSYNFKENEDMIDRNGLSFFHIICSQGDNELVKFFLKKGVDINRQVEINRDVYFRGYTPLHFAIFYHQPSTVKLLLQSGADITKGRETPLECALSNSHDTEDIIEAIAESALDLNAVQKTTGKTLFHFLLEDTSIHDKRNIIKMFYEKGWNVNCQSNNGDTPLHNAFMGNPENIQALLDLGADINIENAKGETPLMRARNDELESIDGRAPYVLATNYPGVYEVYIIHVEKLKAIGFYVSEKNILCIEEIINPDSEYPTMRIFNSEHYSALQQIYKNEVEKMKHIKVSNYSSLYDILFAVTNRMAFHCNNETFLKIMKLNDFDDQFPSYGYLLKLQLKKGNERKTSLKLAKEALKFILKRELPDCCSEEVLSYLSDNDLKSLIQITTDNSDSQQVLKKCDAGMEHEADSNTESMSD